MKHIQYICLLLAFCFSISMQAEIKTAFDPTNPPEPEALYKLTTQANNSSFGSVSGGGNYSDGRSVYLSAYPASSCKFVAWMDGNTVVSTAASFYYTMPSRSVSLTANFSYTFDPTNPAEPDMKTPKHTLTLLANPSIGGSFSNSSYLYEEGSTFYVYAYTNTGYVFKGWYLRNALVSTSQSYYYTMGTKNDTIVGNFSYEPTNPTEPTSGTGAQYNLTALTQSAELGNTIPFTVYLTNNNIDIVSAKLDMAFPAGVKVAYQSATLSSRKNGHNIVCDTLGSNQYRFTISNENKLAFVGSSGTLLTVPVTLPTDWEENTYHTVALSNAQVTTSASTLTCPVKNGAIKVMADTATLFASFYPDIFLNRVLFSNLSSESAKSFTWDFGDGSKSTEKNVLHTYDSAGYYTVALTAAAGLKTDTMKMNVIIAEKSTWKISGSLSLDKNKTDVKNFTGVPEMFNLLSQSTITGNIFVHTANAQVFDMPVTTDSYQTILLLQQKLKQSNLILSFKADSLGLKSVINFTDNIDQPFWNTLILLSKQLSLSNVEIAIQGIPFDIYAINQFTNQVICSETKTEQYNFKLISQPLTYPWQLIRLPKHTTGFAINGNDVIPAMTLVNNSTEADTLTYFVQMQLGPTTLSIAQYQIIVLPKVQGELTDLAPSKAAVISSPVVNFSWSPIVNAVYDVYLWEATTAMPLTPTVSNLANYRHTNSSVCQYGKLYKWKVVARGNCNAIESKVDSFSIRQLPDFRVTEISFPADLYTGEEVVIKAKIINKGGDALNYYWTDRLSIALNTSLQGLTTISSNSAWRTIRKDSTYLVEFRTTLPVDTIKYSRFVLTTDANNGVLESDKSNNTLISDSMHIIFPTIANKEYQALCAFYQATSGLLWTNKWNINTMKIVASAWRGVTFDRNGHVTAISLQSNGLNGQLPAILFSLPQLRTLDLYDNQLTGSLNQLSDSIATLTTRSDSLTSINLGQNQLSGEISAFASRYSRLFNLYLANNKLDKIANPLSKVITTLNIQNQLITIDSVKLSVTPELVLPTICTYNHSNQSFDYRPYYSLLFNGNYVGSISYSENKYHLSWNNSLGWMYESGQPLVLRQESGLSAGSSSVFKLLYMTGDANVDQQVDILDVQHTLNNVLGANPQPFNFCAADAYKDSTITVQDIVKVVNIILSSQADTTTTGLQKAKSAFASVNQLYIENNNLVLDAEESVSAMDITLSGISDKELGLALNSSSYQLMSRNLDGGGTRIIIFSPTGKEIKAGKTIIAELYNAAAGLTSAKLSDKSAQIVGVSLSNNAFTDLKNSSDLNFSAFTMSNKALVMLPSNVEKLQASLYTTQGVLVDNRTLVDLHAGKNTINYNSSELNSGVYILKLSANIQDKVRIINTKLIISK